MGPLRFGSTLAALLSVLAATHAGAIEHRGWALRCVGVYERSRAVQGDIQIVRNRRLRTTLTTSSKFYGVLNGASVRASLTVDSRERPIPPTRGVDVHGTLAGTARLRDGQTCTVVGEARTKRVNQHYYRWGIVEFGLICPEGTNFTVGLYDARDDQPLGNGGSIPNCP